MVRFAGIGVSAYLALEFVLCFVLLTGQLEALINEDLIELAVPEQSEELLRTLIAPLALHKGLVVKLKSVTPASHTYDSALRCCKTHTPVLRTRKSHLAPYPELQMLLCKCCSAWQMPAAAKPCLCNSFSACCDDQELTHDM